jgi:hypothetical protein
MSTELKLVSIRLDFQTLRKVKLKMLEIKELSPYESTILCKLRKSRHLYLGDLGIQSLRSQFFIRLQDGSLHNLLEKLFVNLKGQLVLWKKDRVFEL